MSGENLKVPDGAELNREVVPETSAIGSLQEEGKRSVEGVLANKEYILISNPDVDLDDPEYDDKIISFLHQEQQRTGKLYSFEVDGKTIYSDKTFDENYLILYGMTESQLMEGAEDGFKKFTEFRKIIDRGEKFINENLKEEWKKFVLSVSYSNSEKIDVSSLNIALDIMENTSNGGYIEDVRKIIDFKKSGFESVINYFKIKTDALRIVVKFGNEKSRSIAMTILNNILRNIFGENK